MESTTEITTAPTELPTNETVPTTEEPTAPLPVTGDVNADGVFNIADVILFQKCLLAVPDTHLTNWKMADFCKDDKLNVFDLCMMKRELLAERTK